MVDEALEERVVDERYRKVGSGNGKSQEQVRDLLVLVGPCGQILTKKSIKIYHNPIYAKYAPFFYVLSTQLRIQRLRKKETKYSAERSFHMLLLEILLSESLQRCRWQSLSGKRPYGRPEDGLPGLFCSWSRTRAYSVCTFFLPPSSSSFC